jgi:hypothetical protein
MYDQQISKDIDKDYTIVSIHKEGSDSYKSVGKAAQIRQEFIIFNIKAHSRVFLQIKVLLDNQSFSQYRFVYLDK